MYVQDAPDQRSFFDDVRDHPVTAAIAAAAIGAFIEQQRAPNKMLELFSAYPPIVYSSPTEAWRLITTTLLHANFLHIFFNVAIFWGFGKAIERWLGPWKALALFLPFALVSSAAELVGGNYGIGLSGVVYGYFGILMVGRKYRFDMSAACNKRTVDLLIFWFVLCIGLTIAKVMPIGNYAHGTGLLGGFLLGKAVFDLKNRLWWIGALSALVAAVGGLAIFAPQIHQLLFG